LTCYTLNRKWCIKISRLSKLAAWGRLDEKEKDIVSKIKNSFSDEVTSRDVKKKSFSPSKIVWGEGACPRFWYFMFSGVTVNEVFTHESKRAMQSGTDAHADLQDKLLKRSGLDIVIEQELRYADPPIRAFADGVITTEDGKKIPLEIKTTRTEAYEVRERNFHGADGNIVQLLVYMKILGADKGFLLYEDRNDFRNLVIPVYMDEENTKLVDDLFEWMRQTRRAFDDQTIPAYFKGRRSNSKICKDCPVKELCDNTGEGIVDLPLLKLKT
jgi:CRISPR/Cas system-associated exonuclease Cas4 (RecB family)